MLELAYLTDLLQNLRQRSPTLAQMMESRRPNSTTESSSSPFRTRSYDHSEPLDPLLAVSQFRPPTSISVAQRLRPNMTERSARSDPLDFNQFMDDVYRMFPFN